MPGIDPQALKLLNGGLDHRALDPLKAHQAARALPAWLRAMIRASLVEYEEQLGAYKQAIEHYEERCARLGDCQRALIVLLNRQGGACEMHHGEMAAVQDQSVVGFAYLHGLGDNAAWRVYARAPGEPAESEIGP